jgi:hypothetical protein
MELALLLVAYFASACWLSAAGAAWSSRFPQRSWTRALGRVLSTLLSALHLGALAFVAYMRWEEQLAGLPVFLLVALCLAHLAVSEWFFVLARRGESWLGWSAARHAVAGLITLGFAGGIFRLSELQASFELSHLRVQAGETAWRFSPPRARPEDDAAPIYERVAEQLFGGPDPVEERKLEEFFDNARPRTAENAELVAALAARGPALDELVAASERAACDLDVFARGDTNYPPYVELMRCMRLLELRSSVRASQGDLNGAARDLRAVLDMLEHISRSPTLIALSGAASSRRVVAHECAYVLAHPEATAATVELLAGARRVQFAALLPAAVEMELAGFHARLYEYLEAPSRSDESLGNELIGRLGTGLYKVVHLRDDLAHLERAFDGLRALALADPRDAAGLERQANSIRAAAEEGVLARTMVPTTVRYNVIFAHRADARQELFDLACRAVRARIASGSYPATLDGLPANVVYELDEQGFVLRRTDWGDDELSFAVPPRAPEKR